MIGKVATEGRIVLYRDVPPKALFRALKPETSPILGNKVDNIGVFVKIGYHSVDFVKAKDAIFDLNMPCRIVSLRVDSSHLSDWSIVNQGRTVQ